MLKHSERERERECLKRLIWKSRQHYSTVVKVLAPEGLELDRPASLPILLMTLQVSSSPSSVRWGQQSELTALF